MDYSHTWKRRCLMSNFILEKAKQKQKTITDACWITENTKEVSMFFTDFKQAFDCALSQLWNVLRKMELPEPLTVLMKNLYKGQETIV